MHFEAILFLLLWSAELHKHHSHIGCICKQHTKLLLHSFLFYQNISKTFVFTFLSSSTSKALSLSDACNSLRY
uniref:Putative secreted protein n=1 Tax=Rhipicephalus microplus TaxID=6941 RepID=A0A6G5A1G4_RHIMP